MTLRQRYFFVLSIGFIIIGTIIVIRAVLSSAPVPAYLFGLILIALGGVRIRDFIRMRREVHDRDS